MSTVTRELPERDAQKSGRTATRRRARTRPVAPAPPRSPRPQRSPASPGRGAQPARPAEPARPARPARAPFVLLILGLLAGGLVSLLMLTTVLNQGAFTLESLREHNTKLIQRKEALKQEVSYQGSPGVLARKAKSLGMVPGGKANFVDPKGHGGTAGQAPAHGSGGD